MRQRQQNSTSYPITFYMADSTDHNTGAEVEAAAVTVTLSKNGSATFGAALGAVSKLGGGRYALAGNATDRNTLGECVLRAAADGCDTEEVVFEIVAHDPFSIPLATDISTELERAGGLLAGLVNRADGELVVDTSNPAQYTLLLRKRSDHSTITTWSLQQMNGTPVTATSQIIGRVVAP